MKLSSYLIFGLCLLTGCVSTAPIFVEAPTTLETEPKWELPGMDTLRALENADVPIRNPVDDLPTSPPPETPLSLGDEQSFFVRNGTTGAVNEIDATLRYESNDVYFWVESDLPFNEESLLVLAENFDNRIYHTIRGFFGTEWNPGVDGDEHIYILYTRGLGGETAGYFSSRDELHPSIESSSNGHEMFVISATNLPMEDPFIGGVLAHEFEHMIHWYQDRNEEIWLNEGLAQLSAFLSGFPPPGEGRSYAEYTDLQLNTWSTASEDVQPHYDASYLFSAYFAGRFGAEAVKLLVSEQANGFSGIDRVMKTLSISDSESGTIITAEKIFGDWVVANFLQDGNIGDGRYSYQNEIKMYPPKPAETIDDCETDLESRTVQQFGVDYLRITCPGDYNLHFEGDTTLKFLPVDPPTGRYFYWSNRGSGSLMTLTREFSLDGFSGALTIGFDTWFNLTQDSDYVALETRIDGLWYSFLTPMDSGQHLFGSGDFGWAYGGTSGKGGLYSDPIWVHEIVNTFTVDPDSMIIRFTYLCPSGTQDGFVLDNLSIPELGYYTDFESEEAGWETEGFVRVENLLPQTYELSLISLGENITVEKIVLSKENIVDIPLHIDGDVDEIILVVSGTTRYTLEPANYRYQITPLR